MESLTPFGRLVDLTRRLDKSVVAGVDWRPAKVLARDGWNARTLELYSHSGTHVDAPLHFGVEGPTIDELPLDKLAVTCHVVDLSDLPDGHLVTPDELGGVEEKVQPGEGLLLRSGWSHYHGEERYRNGLPRISSALADWCVDREVALLGTEAPSVADVNHLPEVTDIHQRLFRGGITIVEGLVNLEAISTPKVFLLAMPLRIAGGDGAPARVMAIEMEHI